MLRHLQPSFREGCAGLLFDSGLQRAHLVRDDFSGPFLRLGQQRLEFDVVAFLGFHRLFVRAENGAEPDVLQLHVVVTPAPRRGEELLEMHLLPSVHDVNHPLRVEMFVPVADRRQVRGGIVVTAIGFANEKRIVAMAAAFRDEKRIILRRKIAARENTDRTFAFAGNAPLEQIGHDARKQVVIKTFAEGVIKLNAEPLVNHVERFERIFPELFPKLSVLGIALLEQNQFALGGLAHQVIRFRFVLNFPINRFEMTKRIEPEFLCIALALVAEQDHAEAGAPIAEMIVGNDLVSQKAIEPRQRIAEDRAPQMTHVHLLRDVGTAVIDDNGLRSRRDRNSKPVIARTLRDLPRKIIGLQPKIEKTGAGDLRLFRDILQVEGLGELDRQFPRIGLRFLGLHQRRVGLEIAMARIEAGAHVGRGRCGRKKFVHGLATRASSSWRGVFIVAENFYAQIKGRLSL